MFVTGLKQAQIGSLFIQIRGQFHKTAKQELRLKFWKVYSCSVSQNLKLYKSKIFHETGSWWTTNIFSTQSYT